MNGVAVARLRDVCALLTDGTHYTPPDSGTGYPFLTVKNMTLNGLDFSNCSHVTNEEFQKAVANNCAPAAGDVLFSKDGTVGKVHVVEQHERRFVVLSSIAILRPKLDLILPEYLGLVLQNPQTISQATEKKTGSAIRRIILKDLGRVTIPIPSVSEQRHIVEILNRANGIRRLRREALMKSRQLIPALFVEMFGDPATNPMGWPCSRFAEVASYSRYGPRFHNRPYAASGATILRTTDMAFDGSVQWRDAPRIEVSSGELERYQLRPRTLLFTRTGATIGKVALFMGAEQPVIAGAYLIEFGLAPEINEQYAWAFFASKHGQSRLLRGARSVAQPNINAPAIAAIEIPRPPLDLQCTYAARVADVHSVIGEQERAATIAERLMQSLMAQSLEG